jgi:ectoine hydroxylase-related dioxygenase (phytanoyl-CoA dioxygenase family)
MSFDPPCCVPPFFFDPTVLAIIRALIGDRIVADQWGCDVPLQGSEYQEAHADYQRPLFEEFPDLALPPHMLVVSFGLVRIASEHGPIEIAPGTHQMPRAEALRAVQSGETKLCSVPMEVGDVLIRNPWTLHRGTPNTTDTPRAFATIRYVRRWYFDASRDVRQISSATWQTLTPEQQGMLRFPIGNQSQFN